MSRFILLRLAISVVLAPALLSGTAFAQSQDSVAEAARRAREKKKVAAKPAKVFTEDDVKPATPPAAQPPSSFGSQSPSATDSANPPATQTPSGPSGATDPKDEKTLKEIANLKEQIKQAESDLDLLQRQLSLEQDTYLSKPDYAHDTTEKAIVDALKQQATDKQQDVAHLKARLAELQPTQTGSAPPPPKS
jgi:hypothetical protein